MFYRGFARKGAVPLSLAILQQCNVLADDTGRGPGGIQERGEAVTDAEERGARIALCHMLFAMNRRERTSLAEFGRAVGEKEGVEPYSASAMSRLESGEAEPRAPTVIAICKVASTPDNVVDPGWLLFGKRSRAPEPNITTSTLEMLAIQRQLPRTAKPGPKARMVAERPATPYRAKKKPAGKQPGRKKKR